MEDKDKPAYPIYDPEFVRDNDISTGLTKREYFAAKALQGLLADGRYAVQDACIDAINYADTLLDLLNKKP